MKRHYLQNVGFQAIIALTPKSPDHPTVSNDRIVTGRWLYRYFTHHYLEVIYALQQFDNCIFYSRIGLGSTGGWTLGI